MNYILAISGGVDSVVLLDMLAEGELSLSPSEPSWRTKESWNSQESFDAPATIVNVSPRTTDSGDRFIVAHFEHGIRGDDSKADARFVEKLSQKYRLKFEIGHGNLTKKASEDTARQARYTFLRKLAKKYDAQIVTAHHQDDVLETIAINLVRGTGWRGLAVMDSDILRPLIGLRKTQIYQYALIRHLEYVEDATNRDKKYLRNRLRSKICGLTDDTKRQLTRLRDKQLALKRALDAESEHFVSRNDRYFFIMADSGVALEILRIKTKGFLTRPQLQDLLLFIKTARAGRGWRTADIEVSVNRHDFGLVFPRENW